MDLAIPGMFAHYVARKQFIESRVRGFLAERSGSARGESSQGASQVVAQVLVLGGGFDTLALRLAADFPGTRVLEIDHPATQKAKRQGLERLGSLPPNLSLVAADLARVPLVDVLSTSGFNARLPTAYVIEGILMYLEERNVSELFGTLASVGPSDALCVFTAMTSRRDGTVGFEGGRAARVDAWLARQREQFVWGIAPGNIGEFITKTGWRLVESPSAEQLAAQAGFENSLVAIGEFVYVARLSLAGGPETGTRKNPRH
jgi:methyltransferase (TIGR00027 family)